MLRCPRYATNDDTVILQSMKLDWDLVKEEEEEAVQVRCLKTVWPGGVEVGRETAKPSWRTTEPTLWIGPWGVEGGLRLLEVDCDQGLNLGYRRLQTGVQTRAD